MAEPEGDDRPAAKGHALRTLRHRNFRLIWLGQLVTGVGGQMQSVALAWHLFVLTNSTLRVGLFGFFSVIPFMVLSFVGGATADKFDRRRVMLVTQSILMCLSLVLVFTTLTHQVSPSLIYGIAVASGMARAFDGPARQAMIPNLVPREELGAALTLNTMLRQMATIVGPGLGGLVLGLAGLAPTYFINSLSFVAIIGALLIMEPVKAPARQTRNSWQLALGGLSSPPAGRRSSPMSARASSRCSPRRLSAGCWAKAWMGATAISAPSTSTPTSSTQSASKSASSSARARSPN